MRTILIAEDDTDLRTNLTHFLLTEGFNVMIAENGQVAYELAQQVPPDLIVSDVKMPVLEGFQLFKKLKENIRTVSIPFIFITAYVGKHEDTTEVFKGADGYLIKPFELNELIDLINDNLIHEDNASSLEDDFKK